MVAYKRDEIIPATDFARNFSAIFKSLATGVKEKIAVAKNNKLELVMLPIAEYEKLQHAKELLEHIEIYQTIKNREQDATISFDDMMSKIGLNKNDLRD